MGSEIIVDAHISLRAKPFLFTQTCTNYVVHKLVNVAQYLEI